LDAIKITKQESLAEKMKDLADAVKKVKSDADVALDDAKRYNVCYCNPHHFSIYPMTDDNFTVTYFKDNTDRTKKFNLTFEELKKYVTETLKENVGDYVQKAYNKAAENSKDKESKKEEGPQETDEKVVDQVEDKKDLPDSQMQSVDKIKKQVDHSVKGEKASYKYPKQTDKKLTVKPKTFKGKSNKKK
jgi:cation transport regulator ChaB